MPSKFCVPQNCEIINICCFKSLNGSNRQLIQYSHYPIVTVKIKQLCVPTSVQVFFFTSGWFYLTFLIDVCCWCKIQCLYCWPCLSVRPPKTPEVSSCALKSLAAHGSSWNGGALHDLCDLLRFVLIQLFIHLGTLATELWTSGFHKFLRGGRSLRSFPGHLFLNVLIHPHGSMATLTLFLDLGW